ncbi:nose resistant to fluoxetine protein 6-like isoform X2 [Littorina saxatilis]|uniref:Nose resistant-to-fluoxetine protein N-terminal domain-containing protein n=2 Tax=Littorina saxatilis TaxID=31220 RepID=A0AAN9B094_9CAEN
MWSLGLVLASCLLVCLHAQATIGNTTPTSRPTTITTTTSSSNNTTPVIPASWLQSMINVVESLRNSSSGHSSPGTLFADPGLTSLLSRSAQEILSVLARDPGLAHTLRHTVTLDPATQCAADLLALGAGLQQGDMWALQMLDAMGKPVSGILTGQLTFVGDYDECVSISHTNKSHTIQGQFCSLTLQAPAIMTKGQNQDLFLGVQPTLRVHVCLPRSCSETNIRALLAPTAKSLGTPIYAVTCQRRKDPSGDKRFLGVMITFAILTLFCVAGTAYGVYVDGRTDTRQNITPQQKVPAISNGHTNGGFLTEKEINTVDGGHVNGDLTNGNVMHIEGGLSEGVAANEVHVNGDLTNGNVMHMEGGLSEGVMANGGNSKTGGVTQNGTAATPDVKNSSTEGSVWRKVLLSFSVLRNGRKVLDCSHNKADIRCLHGIRVLSITWVVLGHCFVSFGQAQGNTNSTFIMLKHFSYMVLPAALLSVDTFFLLSGCLTSLLFLRSTSKSGVTISGMILYYVHRIWRLTPLYGGILAFYIGVSPYLKEGPYQDVAGVDAETNCRHYWYYNILYVNNVVGNKLQTMCVGWSWYLSNDMQFYVIAPICLIPWALKGRVRILGFVLAGGLILTHVISSGVISYTRELALFTRNTWDYMADIYFVPWCRVGPYAVGLLLGFVLHTTRCTYRMTKMSVFLGWTMATCVGLVLVYVLYDNVGDLTHGIEWSPSQYATYEALGKVVWAVCVAWVVFACCTGHGGYVNTVLSWRAWAPLSRLTYGVYLLHLIVVSTLAGNLKKPFYMDGWTGACFTIAVTVLSFLTAFTFSMLIEAPTLGLEKAVLGNIFHKKK